MSHVTNVIFAWSLCLDDIQDRAVLAKINSLLPPGQHHGLERVDDDSWGGGKYSEVNVALGAFNYLDLITWVKRIEQEFNPRDHDCLVGQFIVQEQDDEGFRIIQLWDLWNEGDRND